MPFSQKSPPNDELIATLNGRKASLDLGAFDATAVAKRAPCLTEGRAAARPGLAGL